MRHDDSALAATGADQIADVGGKPAGYSSCGLFRSEAVASSN